MPKDDDEHGTRWSENVGQLARRIAVAATDAWYRTHGGSQQEIPLSVVAALLLLRQRSKTDPTVSEQVLSVPPGIPFLEFLRRIWQLFVRKRPDLFPRIRPAIAWLWPAPDLSTVAAARSVAEAVINAGLADLTESEARVRSTDLLGLLWQTIHPPQARKPTGQFFTPADVTTLGAQILYEAPGDVVTEPCVGTGGMFRAMAEQMRRGGQDPATVIWIGVDLDEMVLAACAVNVHLWGLGPQVLLAVGDTRTDDWQERAIREHDEAIEVARNIREHRLLPQLLQSLEIAVFTENGDGSAP